MAVYGLAVFLGAFLVFQVQPLLGKYLLPWFGGTPAVWTTCLLAFQVLLLAGYGYAYLSIKLLKPRAQVILHAFLLIAALVFPITPDSSWRPHGSEEPILRICELIAASLGLPFVVLSATAPLLQHWFGLEQPGKSPFRLYALSNVGSQVALLSYPALVETFIGRATQVVIWRIGLAVFGVTCVWVGARVWKKDSQTHQMPAGRRRSQGMGKALWVLLPACGSLLLAAVTNRICQDLAPVALLWVLPLSVYLLSFILSFSGWYQRRWAGPLLATSIGIMGLILCGQITLTPQLQIPIFLIGLFACCMVCHGELYRLRPDPKHLALFYLVLGAGGALGGSFVAVIAPRIFNDYFELHFGILLCGGLFLLAWWGDNKPEMNDAWRRTALIGGVIGICVLGTILWSGTRQNAAQRVYQSRNFYGVLSVYRHESESPAKSLLELVHGRVAHGVQFTATNRAQIPTLYYTKTSGIGRAFELLTGDNRQVGAVGLGIGTVAAYLRPGDRIRFYEINPEVEIVAQNYFSFLKQSAGKVEVVLGDGRLSLESEPDQGFDLLVLDAFNSDSVPVHLLTREAFATYRRQTKPSGLIVVHISNMSVNLEPVVANLAQESGYTARVVEQPISNEAEGILPSTWILLSRATGFTEALSRLTMTRPATGSVAQAWSDNFNGLFAVMRWRNIVRAAASPQQNAYSKPGVVPNQAKVASAIERFRKAVAENPDSPVALNNLACLLATAADPALRDGPESVRLAERACALTGQQNINTLSTLAAAYAEVGRFEDAIATSEKACTLAAERGEAGLLAGNQQMLASFRARRPFHQGSL